MMITYCILTEREGEREKVFTFRSIIGLDWMKQSHLFVITVYSILLNHFLKIAWADWHLDLKFQSFKWIDLNKHTFLCTNVTCSQKKKCTPLRKINRKRTTFAAQWFGRTFVRLIKQKSISLSPRYFDIAYWLTIKPLDIEKFRHSYILKQTSPKFLPKPRQEIFLLPLKGVCA